MTHDEFVAGIRERYSDLFDPANSDEDWRYLITIGPGWWPLVEEYCERAQAMLRDHGEVGLWFVRQIKEKFGGVRIYVRPATERLNVDWYPQAVHDIDPTPVQELLSDLRSQIVERANTTCEECGDVGGLRVINGWYRTCCEKHFEEWQRRKGSI
ncbi:hypothetical protein HFN60_30880 [Rhizobium leguminosarum]|uniref:hypothetical protein n=1 Tax=Rhizobium leguminosarum TaxID=384 RepID=UPI001C914972|nr:hypothetical protein [Rhizobium leguminosarum]MBY3044821.1 hypothetical protein [Rhizobium leguminosarum]MBY5819998.1 hypothetical protein [Rhizobium leguminosarum]